MDFYLFFVLMDFDTLCKRPPPESVHLGYAVI